MPILLSKNISAKSDRDRGYGHHDDEVVKTRNDHQRKRQSWKKAAMVPQQCHVKLFGWGLIWWLVLGFLRLIVNVSATKLIITIIIIIVIIIIIIVIMITIIIICASGWGLSRCTTGRVSFLQSQTCTSPQGLQHHHHPYHLRRHHYRGYLSTPAQGDQDRGAEESEVVGGGDGAGQPDGQAQREEGSTATGLITIFICYFLWQIIDIYCIVVL